MNDDELRSLRVAATQDVLTAERKAAQRARRDTLWMWIAAAAAGAVIVLLVIAESSGAR